MDLNTEINHFLQEALSKDKNVRLMAWYELASLQKKLKEVEMKLRAEMVENFFDMTQVKVGTNTAEIGNGWKLKLKHGYNYTLDKEKLPGVLKKMPEGIAEKLVVYKPELSMTVFNKLTINELKIFSECVTKKPASPALELVPPKQTE